MDERQKELDLKLFRGEISPQEYVEEVNRLHEEEWKKHREPIGEHEHI